MAEPAFTLASGSAIRAQVLRNAGVAFAIDPARVDEAAIKSAMGGAPIEQIASALADAKAREVSARTPGLVLGGDQILRLDGRAYDKVATLHAARERLLMLRDRTHELVGAVSLARDGEIVRRHQEISRLTMRPFSEAFLDAYLAEEGEGLLASVGCYRFEGMGAQLFAHVQGDHFAILGLPLLPVLALLREEGAAAW